VGYDQFWRELLMALELGVFLPCYAIPASRRVHLTFGGKMWENRVIYGKEMTDEEKPRKAES